MTALSVVSLRVILPLYIASTLSDIAEHHGHTSDSKAKWIELACSVVFLLFFIALSTTFYFRMKKKWESDNTNLTQRGDPPTFMELTPFHEGLQSMV